MTSTPRVSDPWESAIVFSPAGWANQALTDSLAVLYKPGALQDIDAAAPVLLAQPGQLISPVAGRRSIAPTGAFIRLVHPLAHRDLGQRVGARPG